MRTLVWEKRIVHLRLGRRILFPKEGLDKFVDDLKQKVA
jgi:hypothetical protein